MQNMIYLWKLISSCDFIEVQQKQMESEKLRSVDQCLNFNNALNRSVPPDPLRSSQPLTLSEVLYLITKLHLLKAMCVQHTVCADLTRCSVVGSRIAVFYFCLKIYTLERGRIIYFMSTTDCPFLCVCACVCLAASGLPLCTIGFWWHVYIYVRQEETDFILEDVCFELLYRNFFMPTVSLWFLSNVV